jgi:hypothetical protein
LVLEGGVVADDVTSKWRMKIPVGWSSGIYPALAEGEPWIEDKPAFALLPKGGPKAEWRLGLTDGSEHHLLEIRRRDPSRAVLAIVPLAFPC